MSVRPAALAGVLGLLGVLLLVLGCAGPQPSYDVIGPSVTVGPEKSCSELKLSDIRCTAIVLRAAATLDSARPGHAAITGQTLHAAGPPTASAPSLDATTEVTAIVVFALADGRNVAFPIICPLNGTTADRVCNPALQ